jgi:hypothetical protein
LHTDNKFHLRHTCGPLHDFLGYLESNLELVTHL